MRAVWKYELELNDEPTKITMPVHSSVVHVDAQNQQGFAPPICLWVEVVPEAPTEDRYFQVVGTGHPVPTEGKHVGTALTSAGLLVWHVYEVEA